MKADQNPKIVLVTGGSAGIGGRIVTHLAERKYVVLFCGRDEARGRQKERELEAFGGKGIFLQADLSSQDGVLSLARLVRERTDRLDALVNNVGAVYESRRTTAEGVEATIALNHVHPVLLSASLFDLLEGCNGRVIQLSTGYHHLVRLTKSDLNARRWDCGMNVYGRAKLVSVQAGQRLGELWSRRGVGLHFADPGMAETPLTQSMTPRMFPWYGRFLVPFIRAVQHRTSLDWCSSSSVFLVDSPELVSPYGVYVLPGPRVLPKPLIGFSSARSQKLLDFTLSLLTPSARSIVEATLVLPSASLR